MIEPPEKFAHGDYTVGWICALPDTELVAAMAMLDEEHPVLPAADPHDSNSYVLGRIGDHNVVIACLPAEITGKVSAATVAKDMIRSFPAVRFGLMVGIGGGAPYYGVRGNAISASEEDAEEDFEDSEDDPDGIRDIRLGDVVISLHSKSSDAVVQYDFGKSLQGKEFIHSGGKLNKPPSIVLSAVAHLKAQHELRGHRISETLSNTVAIYPALATKFQYPGSRKDCLFKSDIIHVEGNTSCKTCRGPSDSNLVKRKERPDNSPRLHYGTIGSADQVMKNAVLRDQWAQKENIICFEMEAAGLMDSFPCLVIRGICDYADSHKNKVWQPYSAATAASYAKELLLSISGQGVMKLNPIKQITKFQVEKSVIEIRDAIKDTRTAVQSLSNTNRHGKVLAKLPYAKGSSFDASDAEHDARCHPKTRVDLLRQIQDWAVDPRQKCMFWLNGMAGTGKSTISRTIAQSFMEKGQLGASFFFKRGERDCGTAKVFITTICAQLLLQVPALISHVEKAIDADPYISQKRMKEQFDKLILQPLLSLNGNDPRTFMIVIDALDECEDKDDIRAVLRLLPQMEESKYMRLRIFLTSRPDLAVRLGFKQNKSYQDLILHELPKPVIEHDIRIYLEDELAKIRDDRSLPSDWPTSEAIEELVRVAVPLFIFAATACRFIKDGTHPRKRLQRFLDFQATTFASQMDKVYLPVLNQLIRNEGDDSQELLREFQNVVGVIILLASPLSVESLSQLLQLSAEDISELLDPLHSVLNIPSKRGTPVRILHLSFRDYLLITESPFHVDEEETHAKIVLHCLHIMNSHLKHNICALTSYGTQCVDIDSQTINKHLTPELQYSCHHWVYHLKQSKGHISEAKILSFLKQHFLHWLEVLSLLGSISEAVGIIDTLDSGILISVDAEFLEFLYNARRFTLKNAYVASVAPLQLYCSGLVFSPMQSPLRKIFHDDIPRVVCILPQLDDSWSPSLQTLEGHSHSIKSVAFSPDSKILATGSGDNIIKLWDSKSGKEMLEFGNSNSVQSVAFSPDGHVLASGFWGWENPIKLWDTKTGVLLQECKSDTLSVNSVAFSPDGHILASGSDNNSIELWDTKTGTRRQILKGHQRPVHSISFSPNGWVLASSSYDYTIKLWETKTGNQLQTLKGHSGLVSSVAFSHDGQILVSGSWDKTIKLWDVKTSTMSRTLMGHLGPVLSVTISSDGQTLASGSKDSTVRIWHTKTGAELQTLMHWAPVHSVVFSPDGKTLASGSDDGTTRIWDAKSIVERQVFRGHSAWVKSMAFSPDGKILASSSHDNTINILNAKTGTEQHILKGHRGSVESVAFSPDGQILASGSRDGTIKLWDTKTGAAQQLLRGHLYPVLSVAFSRNGTLASGSEDKTIKLWDAQSSALLQTLKGHSDLVSSVAFSHDGQILASGSRDRTIKLWDIKTGAEQQTLRGHLYSILSVAFSQSGRILASGSQDKTIKIWDINTGTEMQTLKGHLDWVISVGFSPEGQTLVSGSLDSTIKIWGAKTGIEKHFSSLSVSNTPHGDGYTGTRFVSVPLPHSDCDSTSYNSHHQVSLSNNWVAIKGEDILWLPPEHRRFSSFAFHGATLALGYGDGRVFMVGIHSW